MSAGESNGLDAAEVAAPEGETASQSAESEPTVSEDEPPPADAPAPSTVPASTSPPGERSSRPSALSRPPVHALAGRYRLERPLSRATTGTLFLARDLELDQPTAVKILDRFLVAGDADLPIRFDQLGPRLMRLAHPNVLSVLNYGESDSGELFIAMEYRPGRPMSLVIERDGPLSFRRVVQITAQIARATREAHDLGILHGDLGGGNGGNVLIVRDEAESPDFVKVFDFGLVNLFRTAVNGSPLHAPEQTRSRQLDPRSDVFAVGGILFWLITGRPPFLGADPAEPLPRFAKIGYHRACPPELEELARRCLEHDPARRPASMDHVLTALRAFGAGVTGEHRVDGFGPPTQGMLGGLGELSPPDAVHESQEPAPRTSHLTPPEDAPVLVRPSPPPPARSADPSDPDASPRLAIVPAAPALTPASTPAAAETSTPAAAATSTPAAPTSTPAAAASTPAAGAAARTTESPILRSTDPSQAAFPAKPRSKVALAALLIAIVVLIAIALGLRSRGPGTVAGTVEKTSSAEAPTAAARTRAPPEPAPSTPTARTGEPAPAGGPAETAPATEQKAAAPAAAEPATTETTKTEPAGAETAKTETARPPATEAATARSREPPKPQPKPTAAIRTAADRVAAKKTAAAAPTKAAGPAPARPKLNAIEDDQPKLDTVDETAPGLAPVD